MSVYWETRTRIEQRVQRAAAREFIARYGHVVQGGPFAGMRYLSATRDPILPKLVGSYEAESHPWIRAAIEKRYRTVIDVGCAEGYFSVGLALALPDAKVYGFDTELDQQSACRRLAEINGVEDQVIIRGEFSVNDFRLIEPATTLVIMDCEGSEFEFLDLGAAPALAKCDVLVEIHPFVGTPARDLLDRFARSHTIATVKRQRRHAKEWPSIQFLSPIKRYAALLEFRWDPDLCWSFLCGKRCADGTIIPEAGSV